MINGQLHKTGVVDQLICGHAIGHGARICVSLQAIRSPWQLLSAIEQRQHGIFNQQ